MCDMEEKEGEEEGEREQSGEDGREGGRGLDVGKFAVGKST